MRIIVNALLFSLLHLNLWTFDEIFIASLLSRFGGHLIALWLVLNYSLIYGVIYHMIWNASLILIMYVAISLL
jgi:hypothetical protein